MRRRIYLGLNLSQQYILASFEKIAWPLKIQDVPSHMAASQRKYWTCCAAHRPLIQSLHFYRATLCYHDICYGPVFVRPSQAGILL